MLLRSPGICLGQLVVRRHPGELLAGQIFEVEAYQGEEDLGCHAKAGLTPRTRVMYGPPGRAYIYFTYGMHWMLNAVTGAEGVSRCCSHSRNRTGVWVGIYAKPTPSAEKQSNRNLNKGWTDGPAKLCQVFGLGW